MKIFLTGASGSLAHHLLPTLLKAGYFVFGVDKNRALPTCATHRHYQHIQGDFCAPAALHALRKSDICLHGAFLLGGMRSQHPNRARWRFFHNVLQSKRLFSIAVDFNVSYLLFISSIAAQLTGSSFPYAQDKIAVEQYLTTLNSSSVKTASLRLPLLLGRPLQLMVARMLSLPFYPNFQNPGKFSCLATADAARGILALVNQQLAGNFCLSSQPALSWQDYIEYYHGFALPLPVCLFKQSLQFFGHWDDKSADPYWFDHAQASLIMDCTSSEKLLDFRPELSCQEAIFTLKNSFKN
jgi:nucleoside-diphosphate-sugar epimerase